MHHCFQDATSFVCSNLDVPIVAANLYAPVVVWLVDFGGVKLLNFVYFFSIMTCPGWLCRL